MGREFVFERSWPLLWLFAAALSFFWISAIVVGARFYRLALTEQSRHFAQSLPWFKRRASLGLLAYVGLITLGWEALVLLRPHLT